MEIDAHTAEWILMVIAVPAGGYMVKRIMNSSEHRMEEIAKTSASQISDIASNIKAMVSMLTNHGTELELLKQWKAEAHLKIQGVWDKTREQDDQIQRIQVTLATQQQILERRRGR